MSREIKRKFMDMAVSRTKQDPAKGIELSIVKEEYCKLFVYPTPFELSMWRKFCKCRSDMIIAGLKVPY